MAEEFQSVPELPKPSQMHHVLYEPLKAFA